MKKRNKKILICAGVVAVVAAVISCQTVKKTTEYMSPVFFVHKKTYRQLLR